VSVDRLAASLVAAVQSAAERLTGEPTRIIDVPVPDIDRPLLREMMLRLLLQAGVAGADSLAETFAGLIVVWRFADRRTESESAEQRAQRLIGLSFFLVAAYVAVEALRTLVAADHPNASWVGIGLAAVTLVTMPALASAKARVGEGLGSSATKSEGRQNLLCAYLSAGLLVGLSANALLSWWWADPVAGLVIVVYGIKEGRAALSHHN